MSANTLNPFPLDRVTLLEHTGHERPCLGAQAAGVVTVGGRFGGAALQAQVQVAAVAGPLLEQLGQERGDQAVAAVVAWTGAGQTAQVMTALIRAATSGRANGPTMRRTGRPRCRATIQGSAAP